MAETNKWCDACGTLFCGIKAVAEHNAFHEALRAGTFTMYYGYAKCQFCDAIVRTAAEASHHIAIHKKLDRYFRNRDIAFHMYYIHPNGSFECKACGILTVTKWSNVDDFLYHFEATHMNTPPRMSRKCPQCTFCGCGPCPLDKTSKSRACSRVQHLRPGGMCHYMWVELKSAFDEMARQRAAYGLVLAHRLAMRSPRVNKASPLKTVDAEAIRNIVKML